MVEIINNEKLPWPSRLGDISFYCMIGAIILGTVVISIGTALTTESPNIGKHVEIILGISFLFALILFVISFLLSTTALLGMFFHRISITCRGGKALGTFIFTFLILFLGTTIIAPAFLEARKAAYRINCGYSIRILGSSWQMYALDYDSYPKKANWCDLTKPYLEENDNLEYFICPNDKTGPCSYAMNENIPDDANELPDDLVLLFESTPGWNQIGGPDDVVTDRHKRPGASVTFAGGRVEFVKPEDIPNLRWTVEE